MKKLCLFTTVIFISLVHIYSQISPAKQNGKFESLLYIEDIVKSSRSYEVANHYSAESHLIHISQNKESRLDSIVFQQYNSATQMWENEEKYEYILDSEGNILHYKNYDYDFDSMGWIGSWYVMSVFDSINNSIFHQNHNWDEDISDWKAYTKYETSYDEFGNWIETINHDWDDDLETWLIDYKSKNEYSYNANQMMTEEIYLNWDEDNSKWDSIRKTTYMRDVDDNVMEELEFSWNDEISQWSQPSIIEYNYDSNNRVIEKIFYNKQSEVDRKTDYVYDDNSNLIQSETAQFVEGLGWILGRIMDYEYDSSSNLLEITTSEYEEKGDIPINVRKETYAYDLSISRNSLLLPISDWLSTPYSNQFLNKPLGDTTYYWEEDEWQLNYRTIFYYNELAHYSVIDDSLCFGDSLLFDGNYLSTEGVYYGEYVSIEGYDSIVEIRLKVNPKPDIPTITGNIVSDINEVQSYSVPFTPSNSYSWDVVNGNIISNSNGNSVQVQWSNAGIGVIKNYVINQYGCSSESSELNVTIGNTGVWCDHKAEILVYPNPASTILRVVSTIENSFKRIYIVDSTGRIIREEDFRNGMHEFQINDLSSGVYIVELSGDVFYRITFIKI